MKNRRLLARTVSVLIICTIAGIANSDPAIYRNLDYVDGVVYEENRDRLDIYMPADAQNVPVIVYFHGGALSAGSKESAEGVALRAVENGIGFVSANHRLSPAVTYPAHIEDAAAATAWVIKNIDDYGGDPNNIYLSGHSSGAYLATILKINAKHLAAHGINAATIQGAIPISPFLYVEETAAVRPKSVWGTEPADWLRASSTHHIKEDSGRILLIYADGDAPWRKSQITRFSAAMQAKGNDAVEAVEVPNRNHGSLISLIAAEDDQITNLIKTFVD